MLDAVGLIHMNGRLYDPVLARFVSADSHIQDSFNLQSYNRYTYVLNNPLSATDPSGYLSIFGHKILPGVFNNDNARVVAAIGVNFIPGLNIYAAGFMSGMISSNGNLQAGIVGALTAGAFNGVGNMGLVQGSFESVLAHGFVGGASSALMGGDFRSGFLAAGFTQAFAPTINGIDRGTIGPSLERTMVAAIVGGTASVIGGGKFANGAITGAFSRLYNDDAASHRATPHVLNDPGSYVGRDVYLNGNGDAQCVELIKQTLGGYSSLWLQGDPVASNLNVSPGTAIATFVNGRFPTNNSGQHAAIYLGQSQNGIIVVDQYKGLDTIQWRIIPFSPPNGSFFRGGLSNNGNAYSIILWK